MDEQIKLAISAGGAGIGLAGINEILTTVATVLSIIAACLLIYGRIKKDE